MGIEMQIISIERCFFLFILYFFPFLLTFFFIVIEDLVTKELAVVIVLRDSISMYLIHFRPRWDNLTEK